MVDLSQLNEQQRKVASTTEGPVLVLAGAGSGKTRALTYRVAHLVDMGVPPWSIMAITFTNKAAAEMKQRIENLVGPSASDIWVSTFHSSCAKILRRDIEKLGYSRSFTIYDDDDQMRLIKEILKKKNIDDKYLPPRQIKAAISDAKNKCLGPQEWLEESEKDFKSEQIFDVFKEYEEKLKASNALDFDDLIVKTLELFAMHPPVLEAYQKRYRYIHVDEYQDTNYAQYMLVNLIAKESRNLCVVGDDDQSIYGWRGADIKNILDFEKDYPGATVIKLEQNYRSTSNILDAANQVIAQNEHRKDKHLWTNEDSGDPICFYQAQDERAEAAWVCQQIRQLNRLGAGFSDIAVLYRTNSQSRVVEEALVQSGIRYRIYGGMRFYDRKEVKDILAYLHILVNPSDDISVLRIINTPKRSIGDTTIAALTEAAEREGVPVLSACMDIPEGISSRARKSIEKFSELIMQLTLCAETMPLTQLVQHVIDTVGLESQYKDENSEESQARIENIREFMGAVSKFEQKSENPTLSEYLENVSLVSDLDSMTEEDAAVTMMTLHSAKGLEFPDVFIIGMEENLFPSYRSTEDESRMEEETRLCYVGITRANKRLFLTCASQRMLYNQMQFNDRSRFLQDIPERVMINVSEQRQSFRKGNASAYERSSQNWNRSTFAPMKSTSVHENTDSSWSPRFSANRSVSSGSRQSLNSWTQKTSSASQSVSIGGKAIPGLQKGFSSQKFVPSAARKEENVPQVFAEGDRIMHKKFGKGVITHISGSGNSTRLSVQFDDPSAGLKEFSASIAPIMKVEG